MIGGDILRRASSALIAAAAVAVSSATEAVREVELTAPPYRLRSTKRRPGPGWTYAKVKRMARKRRGVAQHKSRCKGGRRG